MVLSKKTAQNTFWQLLGKLVSALATFLILGLVARRFGEEGTGEFTLVLAYVALFYLLADFGFNAVVVKKMVAQKEKAVSFFRNLLGLRFVWAGALIVLALAVSRILPYSPFFKLGVLLTLATIFTQAVLTTSNAFFQFRRRYDLSVLASSLGGLTVLFLASGLIFKGVSLVQVLVAYPVGGAVMAAGSLVVIRRFQLAVSPRLDASVWRSFFKATFPLALTLIVDLLHFKVDAFLLAYFRPMTEVGIYNLAYKIFENILVFPVFFVNSVYPDLVTGHLQGIQNLRLMTAKALRFLVLVSLVISLGLLIFSPLAIRLLAGRGFAGSVTPLRLLSFSLPAFFVTALLMWVLITLGQQWLLFRIYLLAMILDLGLNLIFIPRFGYLAAAAITGITEGLVLFLESFLVWKFLNQRR